ncbi:MAG: hypothetical protein H0X38_03695 [Planctomycetes bacterium]|nr:hypothetical protein [Planctomycetota bacterium]
MAAATTAASVPAKPRPVRFTNQDATSIGMFSNEIRAGGGVLTRAWQGVWTRQRRAIVLHVTTAATDDIGSHA